MSEFYLRKLQDRIDDKIIEHVLDGDKSINDAYILYHHHIQEVSRLFYNANEHMSKIMVIAYKKTIKSD